MTYIRLGLQEDSVVEHNLILGMCKQLGVGLSRHSNSIKQFSVNITVYSN